ncbi:hypothetical protein [Mycobacterium ostraviense]|nr:hypothetical protein [Mycobacterium ostraviense]
MVANADHDVAAPPGIDRAGFDGHVMGAERCGQPIGLGLPRFD